METTFIIIEAILILAAAPPYIIDTIKHKTKPERATWFILSILSVIGFVAELRLGANWSLLFLGIDGATSLAIFALSIPWGVGGFTLLDRYALVVAAIGVVIAIAAHQPLIALLGNILADAAGTGLTIRKAYLRPSTETTISWLLVGGAGVFAALSVGKLDFSLLLWPVYLVIANLAVPAAQGLGRLNSKT